MNEEYLKTLYNGHISYELFLKQLFINAQNRYVWAKNELEATFKDRVNFPPAEPLSLEYKEMLKDIKKDEEKMMKTLETELQFERENLNPPFYYNYAKRRTE